MKPAGLTNEQILRSATATAAKAFGGAIGAKIGRSRLVNSPTLSS